MSNTIDTQTDTAAPTDTHTIAVIGAGGKMGMRVSDNLVKTAHTVSYSENSPAGQERVREAGRELTETADAVRPDDRGINQIVEHWLPWQGDPETTVTIEREWTRTTLDYLRSPT